jgi:acetyl esterase/lipase
VQVFGNHHHISFSVNVDSLLEYDLHSQHTSDSHFSRYPVPKDTTLVSGTSYTLSAEWTSPPLRPSRPRKIILFIHGGAFVFGSAVMYRVLSEALAKETGYPVLAVNYRLAPEHPFPAALHDVLAAYLYLLNPAASMFKTEVTNRRHEAYNPEDIVLLGN